MSTISNWRFGHGLHHDTRHDAFTVRIGLGTRAIGGWMWAARTRSNPSPRSARALDRGVTLIDTAPAYGQGRSEEIVGRAIERWGSRDRVVIATKVGLEWRHDGEVVRNASRERVTQEIADSLRRLRTDYVDIYQVHWPDPARADRRDRRGAPSALQRRTHSRDRRQQFLPRSRWTRFREVAPLHTVQPPYNLFEREAEDDVLPVLPHARHRRR